MPCKTGKWFIGNVYIEPQEQGITCEFSLPLAIKVLFNPPKHDLITYLCCLWPLNLDGISHFPSTSHIWISWLLRLTMKNLLSPETERDVIGCSSEMTRSEFVPICRIRISLSKKMLIRYSPSGVTARSTTLGILIPLHDLITFPSQSHMQTPFSGSELPHANCFELGNQAQELTTKPWFPNVRLHVPVSTSHSFKTSVFPHVSNLVSSGLHATKDTACWWPLSVCFSVNIPSSSTWQMFSEHLKCLKGWELYFIWDVGLNARSSIDWLIDFQTIRVLS